MEGIEIPAPTPCPRCGKGSWGVRHLSPADGKMVCGECRQAEPDWPAIEAAARERWEREAAEQREREREEREYIARAKREGWYEADAE